MITAETKRATAQRVATIDEEVLAVLGRADIQGKTVRLVEQLDRALYTKTNKVIEALGGTWNRKEKAHVFDEDAEERIADALSTGTYQRPSDLGFFQTPPDVAYDLVRWAEIGPTHTCLEPSAGEGRLLVEVERYVQRDNIFAVELDERRTAHLEIAGWQVADGDCLSNSVWHGREGAFDRIVMNPPFAKQQDVLHVQMMYDVRLKPGGIMVAIMSAGTMFRTDAKTQAFYRLISGVGEARPLPEGAFKESGTMVRTVMVKLRKPERLEGIDGIAGAGGGGEGGGSPCLKFLCGHGSHIMMWYLIRVVMRVIRVTRSLLMEAWTPIIFVLRKVQNKNVITMP